jgi:hypothetical protein
MKDRTTIAADLQDKLAAYSRAHNRVGSLIGAPREEFDRALNLRERVQLEVFEHVLRHESDILAALGAAVVTEAAVEAARDACSYAVTPAEARAAIEAADRARGLRP